MNEPDIVSPSLSTTPPPLTHSAPTVSPRIDPIPAATRPQQRAATLPPQRENQLSWMIAAGAGAIVIAGVVVWSMNRPTVTPSVPPAIVTGSAELPPTQVAAATPTEPAPAADRDSTTAPTAAATPTAAEPAPARLGPPVTTVKPAAETRQVAQAAVPAPRPDLVLRANPRSAALEPLPSQQAPAVIAAAPAIQPDTAPIVLPPTAAGPSSVTPQPALPATTPPVASTAPVTPPDATANSTSPGTPPLAQAPLPAVEDSGITMKVRSALASDSTLAAVPIAVSTDHGVVKLEGQAPDAPTRERATVVASSATGVKAVDNRLTLPPAAVVSQAPSGQ
jgi:hypothetical protein